MPSTALTLADRLPLTCTREGVCCHGHQIFICPWELARLARQRGLTPRAFRDRHTDLGGIRLRFDGPLDGRGKRACGQHDVGAGCTVHPARPLACRLYPLGRDRPAGAVRYHHPGPRPSCLDLCPTVDRGPWLTVGDYLHGQDTAPGEAAHDAYAGIAYGMVTGARLIIARSTAAGVDAAAITAWFAGLRARPIPERVADIPTRWLDRLTIPDADLPIDDSAAFAAAHAALLHAGIQSDFAGEADPDLDAVARLMLAMGLHLGQSVGTDAEVMARILAG